MKNYLVLPINNNKDLKDVVLVSKDGTNYGLSVRLDAKEPKYHVYVDVTFLNEIESINLNENEYSFASKRPDSLYKEKLRPKIHYTVPNGWNNDPNGMLYFDGVYHMFYQFNPAGNTWGNMHWGHATSTDMIHYKEEDVALRPDFLGAVYSGSAFVDYENVSGLKENENDPIILFYTAAGFRFNQCIAYSTDKGKTFKRYEKNPIIPFVTFWNRDPKVIKCEELDCYVMAVFLQDENNNFILYKSKNLLDWEEIQRVAITWDYECPDIYKIKVEETNEYVYVLQGACGSYIIGKVKDGKFEFDLNVKKCLYGKYIDYCAQSFANLGERIVQVNWQKSIVYEDMPWGSNLSLPQEVSMHQDENGDLQLYTYIAKEFDNVEKQLYKGVKPDYDCGYDITAIIDVNEQSIIKCFGIEIPLPEEYNKGTLEVRIIVDTIGVSFYINKGAKYTALASLPDYNSKPLEIINGQINNSEIYIVKSFY